MFKNSSRKKYTKWYNTDLIRVKLLLSALIKAKPDQNFELKKLYENENLKTNKHPAEYQGQLFYPSKSFAALQNLVRLSL